MHSRYLLNSIVITDSCSNWKCKLIIVRVEGAKGLIGLIYLSMCNFFSRVHYRVKNIWTNSPNRFATDCKSVYVRSVFVWLYCFCLVMCVRVRVWNNMYFLYPHVFFLYICIQRYMQESIIVKLRYVLVGWSSCLPAVGCNMMVESSSLQLPPPAVGHKLIYIPYIL